MTLPRRRSSRTGSTAADGVENFARDGRLAAVLDFDDATWLCSRGWALFIAVMTFPYYWQTMPVRRADRLVMARAALDG